MTFAGSFVFLKVLLNMLLNFLTLLTKFSCKKLKKCKLLRSKAQERQGRKKTIFFIEKEFFSL